MCFQKFSSKAEVVGHEKTVHAPRVDEEERPYGCKFCGKRFRKWDSLNNHEKHDHVVCNICSRYLLTGLPAHSG